MSDQKTLKAMKATEAREAAIKALNAAFTDGDGEPPAVVLPPVPRDDPEPTPLSGTSAGHEARIRAVMEAFFTAST